MKIKYNIAKNKKLDTRKFFLFCVGALLFSVLFIALGVNNLAVQDKKLSTQKKTQEQYKTRLNDMRKKTGEYNEGIRRINSMWRSRVRLANSLIVNKSFNTVGKLDIIEELLPVGVYIKSISIAAENKSKVQISLVSDAYPRLFEAYKNFSKYDAAILNESVKAGIYNAAITVILKTEKKEEVTDKEEIKGKEEAKDGEELKDKAVKDDQVKDEKIKDRAVKDEPVKDEEPQDRGKVKDRAVKDNAVRDRGKAKDKVVKEKKVKGAKLKDRKVKDRKLKDREKEKEEVKEKDEKE